MWKGLTAVLSGGSASEIQVFFCKWALEKADEIGNELVKGEIWNIPHETELMASNQEEWIGWVLFQYTERNQSHLEKKAKLLCFRSL